MKKWRETQQVLRRLARLQDTGVRAALATVVRVSGSAYRQAGARLLVAEDGKTEGNVSGGCLEQDVKEVALRVIRTGQTELRRYHSGPDDIGAWDMGLGCDGQVEIHVEPAGGSHAAILSLLEGDTAFAWCKPVDAGRPAEGAGRRLIVLRPDGRGVAAVEPGTLGQPALDAAAVAMGETALGQRSGSVLHTIGGKVIFIDVFEPPPRLVLIGAGDDARPLSRLALEAGFRVSVVDHRSALLAPERFADEVERLDATAPALASRRALEGNCYVVVMTHNFASDRDYLAELLRTPVPYVGLLGPRQRTARLLDVLGMKSTAVLERIHAPVGLDLGGEGAEQVGFAIISEILAFHHQRGAKSLRDRLQPIHAEAI